MTTDVYRRLKKVNGIIRRIYRTWLHRQADRSSGNCGAGEARLHGYDLTMRFPDRQVWLWQMVEIFGNDCYKVHKLSESPRVIDGGANIGTFSLYLKWLRPKAKVLAFEPSPENCHYLVANISQLPFPPIEVIPMALGGKRGIVGLKGERSDSIRTDPDAEATVEVVPLSDFLAEPTDLLKLDIEGDEFDVLYAAKDQLHTVKRIVIENHEYDGRQSRLTDILMLLRTMGEFDRFGIFEHRDFPNSRPGDIIHCCLVEAWRSRDQGQP